MRSHLGLTGAVILGLAGCSSATHNTSAPVGFIGPVWNSTLTAPTGAVNSTISGFATMMGNTDHSRTRVQLDLHHALAGTELPWHLHRGSCGNDQGIVGDPARYKPLKVGATGEASGDAVLDLPLPDTGQYMVNVHASITDMDSVIACGNMTGPTS